MKKFSLLIVLFVFLSSNNAFSNQPKAKVMFLNTLYGAAVGAAIGAVLILNNSDNWNKKLALGTTIGAFGGLAFGIVEGFELLSNNIKSPEAVPSRPLVYLTKRPTGAYSTTVHLDLVSVYF